MDWSKYFPAYVDPEEEDRALLEDYRNQSEAEGITKARRLSRDIEIADIGCGFGGLLVALSPRLPDKLLIGKRPMQRISPVSRQS
jgi:tRNA G46 methylase TrmB